MPLVVDSLLKRLKKESEQPNPEQNKELQELQLNLIFVLIGLMDDEELYYSTFISSI